MILMGNFQLIILRNFHSVLTTIQFALNQSQILLNTKNKKLRAITETMEVERKKLRNMKLELREDPRMISNLDVDETINLKWKIKELQEANTEFIEMDSKIELVKHKWGQYLKKSSDVPDDFFSELDKKKLDQFEKQFKYYLNEFGYSSTPFDDIEFSQDKYTPIVRGFDIKFDSSASDFIRLKWAYTLTLLFITNQLGGNHPQVILLDEPGQQQMNINSTKKLFSSLTELKGQSVVASSLTIDEINAVTKGLDVNIVDLGEEYIIKPI
jgi:hypothetical protein